MQQNRDTQSQQPQPVQSTSVSATPFSATSLSNNLQANNATHQSNSIASNKENDSQPKPVAANSNGNAMREQTEPEATTLNEASLKAKQMQSNEQTMRRTSILGSGPGSGANATPSLLSVKRQSLLMPSRHNAAPAAAPRLLSPNSVNSLSSACPPSLMSTDTVSSRSQSASHTSALRSVFFGSSQRHKPLRVRCGVSSSNLRAPKEYVCRLLSPVSDEGCRAVRFDQVTKRLYATIGDLHIKCWRTSYDAPPLNSHLRDARQQQYEDSLPLFDTAGVEILKFSRQHTFNICQSTFTLAFEQHIMLLYPAQNGSQSDSMLHHIDTRTMQQTLLPIPLERNDVPLALSQEHLVILREHQLTSDKLILIYNWRRAPYTLLHTLTFAKRHKHYWGFQMSGNTMVHVCCQSKIKVIQLNSSQASAAAASAALLQSTPRLPAQSTLASSPGVTLLHKFSAHKWRVLSFLQIDEESLITLGDDRKIKLWRRGQCMVKYVKIKGVFQFNYPYILKLFHSRLYYTADDGVYVLQLAS